MLMVGGPDHEPKNPKKFEAKFLETFMDAKPGRKTIFLLTNRMTIERCIAPIRNATFTPNKASHEFVWKFTIGICMEVWFVIYL